MYTQNLNLKP